MSTRKDKPIKRHSAEGGQGTEELGLLLAVAHMYYDYKNTQQEIADRLGISRSTVSRLIDRASELGIVQIVVKHPYSRASELRQELIRLFGLADAIVAPTLLDNEQLIAQDIGKAAAEYIAGNLASDAIVGIGRGMSVFQTACSLPQMRLSPTLVPLAGGMGSAEGQYPASDNTRRFAERLGGQCSYLYAPVIVANSLVRDAFLSEPHSSQVVDLWDQLDWVVTGIGRVPPRYASSSSQYTTVLNAFVKETGAEPVADLFSWFVHEDGSIPLTKHAVNAISATPDQVSRTKVRVAVAGGVSKAVPITAVLKSGIISVLVTDEAAAEAIVVSESNKK